MLESVSDFKYLTSTTLNAFRDLIAIDGELVSPLPVRCDCASSLPFSGEEEPDSYSYGDLRTVDLLWLLEAVQERESFGAGLGYAAVPSSIIKAPLVTRDELVSVAKVLKLWASRWEQSSVYNRDCCYVKGDAFGDFSGEWEEVYAVTLHVPVNLYGVENAVAFDYYTVSVADMGGGWLGIPEFIRSWQPTDEQLKKITKKNAVSVFAKYALRDYLSVPRFLGVTPDDDLVDGRFGWKDVAGWSGYYPPYVSAADVLALYSDLEATCGVMLEIHSAGSSVVQFSETPKAKNITSSSDSYVHETCDFELSIEDEDEECPSSFTELSRSSSESSSSSSGVEVRPSVITDPSVLSVLSQWDSAWLDPTSFFGSTSHSARLQDLTQDHVTYSKRRHTLVCNGNVTTFPTEIESSESRLRRSRKVEGVDGEFVLDLRPNAAVNFNDGRDCGIESVSILVASVAVTVESSTYQAARAGLYSSDATEASYAKDYKSDEVYKVNVRVKRVPCTIRENRYAVIPSLSANDIPEAFGGVRIDIENPFVRASHSMGGMGPYVSPPSEQLESKSTLKLKAFCGYGPVLVKFKPNTSVKE